MEKVTVQSLPLTWEEIFHLQATTDGANYHLLKAWLQKHYTAPAPKQDH